MELEKKRPVIELLEMLALKYWAEVEDPSSFSFHICAAKVSTLSSFKKETGVVGVSRSKFEIVNVKMLL